MRNYYFLILSCSFFAITSCGAANENHTAAALDSKKINSGSVVMSQNAGESKSSKNFSVILTLVETKDKAVQEYCYLTLHGVSNEQLRRRDFSQLIEVEPLFLHSLSTEAVGLLRSPKFNSSVEDSLTESPESLSALKLDLQQASEKVSSKKLDCRSSSKFLKAELGLAFSSDEDALNFGWLGATRVCLVILLNACSAAQHDWKNKGQWFPESYPRAPIVRPYKKPFEYY